MVRTSSAQKLHSMVQETIAQGAKPWISVQDFPAYSGEDAYLPPQILTDLSQDSAFMQEECFGPVVGIIPVKSDHEAIRLMNDSRYGLTASVWTRDIEVAQIIGNQIHTGTVYMNRCDYLDPALAWTGVNDTGKGCTLSILGYHAFYQPKSFHLKK
jgi:acyl-CoA reductase-like NAD-dependent aldehyde dehydrogenase